ncbi:hypothetical protein BRN44_02570, partial [Xanthomonas oryzae pv. oryzae]
ASGVNSSAIGRPTNAIGENALAIGHNSFVRQSGENGVAPGANAGVSGANSRTYEDDVVSIGSGNGRGGPATRRITNVTAGVNATDAVNVAQLRHVADVAENTAQFFKASPGEESVGAYVEGDSAL